MKNVFSLFLVSIVSLAQAQNQKLPLLIGTYTNSCDSKGIYVYDFDTNTGDFVFKNATEKVINPSYLALSEDQKIVYSVNENGAESTVSSFQFDYSSGKLIELNKQKAQGADPCYIINDDKNVIVANYSGGNIAVFGKNNNGSLTEAKQVLQHKGKGIHPRQGSAHVHMVYFSPDKKYVLSNDLGTDAVDIYEYHPNTGTEVLKLKEEYVTGAEASTLLGMRHSHITNLQNQGLIESYYFGKTKSKIRLFKKVDILKLKYAKENASI